MSEDAKFEDAEGDAPLRLMAQDVSDLEVISSLLQDAVFSASDISWSPKRREVALLLNRFRWEWHGGAPDLPERVQSILLIRDVASVSSQGFDRKDTDLVLSLLTVSFEPSEDGTGDVLVTLSGDGALRCAVECLDLVLSDVTRPYVAPSRRTPSHPD